MNATTTAPGTIRCGCCHLRHTTVAEVRYCHDYAAYAEAQAASEIYGEAYAAAIIGGSDHFDAAHIARCARDGVDIWAAADAAAAEAMEATPGQCEHGLAAWLCAGPGHYPQDI